MSSQPQQQGAAAHGGAAAAAAASTDSSSVAALIVQRERELAQLRADSVAGLEQRLQAQGEELRDAQTQLAALRAECERGRGELQARAADQAAADAALEAAHAELAAKADLIAQMRQALGEAEQGELSGQLACMPAVPAPISCHPPICSHPSCPPCPQCPSQP